MSQPGTELTFWGNLFESSKKKMRLKKKRRDHWPLAWFVWPWILVEYRLDKLRESSRYECPCDVNRTRQRDLTNLGI